MNFSQLGDSLISLATLLFLEIVLGFDNLVFVAIASSRLPAAQQSPARKFGLLLALVTRLLLLASVAWLASFTQPLFAIFHFQVSGRDLLLGLGGLFLIFKGTQEIHTEFDSHEAQAAAARAPVKFMGVIVQIALLDIVFSLDSVITAIGMTSQYWIMAVAITLAIMAMIFCNDWISNCITHNPTVKMLAISFLIMVGMVLIADGFHYHIPRGYIYFSISFSLLVEALNLLLRRKQRRNKRSL